MIETVIMFLDGQKCYSNWVKIKGQINIAWVQIGEISITSMALCQLTMTANGANNFAALS